VADDLVVVGCGSNDEDADKDHAQNLEALKKRCVEKNIHLNDAKSELKDRQIRFMGHLITSEGVKPDDAKVKAIREMPAPTDVEGVRRLCGMVQYLAKFLPDLASDTEPIRMLTRKDVKWKWSTEQDDAFTKIKDKVTAAPVLAYFNARVPLVLQADSSKDGLGVSLLQDGRPVEFASRALNQTEQNWAQIEKETLAVVFGLERFDQYTFGRKIIVQNDHKPLENILKRPLAQVPKRLQALIMRMHRYDIDFQYLEGKSLLITDTLSRAFLNETEVRVMQVEMTSEVSDSRLQQIREATASDSNLQTLLETIKMGWPNDKTQVPPAIRNYYDMRDILSYQDGIALKGEQIIIPVSMRQFVKSKLHVAHMGYESMLRRARDTVFWPGMAQEIKQIADACDICQEMKPNMVKETLIQHEEPQKPWAKVGLDIFEIAGRHYLVTADYFTNYIEVDYLSSMTSTVVIQKLKSHFSRYGIPEFVMSDGGTQFTSREFAQFASDWGFKHSTSSPNHQQSNGKAEAAVKIIETMMKKSVKGKSDQYEALLEMRNTPRKDTLLSPAQMLFGRATRGLVPSIGMKKPPDMALAKKRRDKRRLSIKRHYDKKARDRPSLHPGHTVLFKRNSKEGWRRGIVQSKHNERSYRLLDNGGATYRRNKCFIRPAYQPPTSRAMERPEQGPQAGTRDQPSQQPIQLGAGEQAAIAKDAEPAEPADQQTSIGPQPDTKLDSRPQRVRKQPAWMKDYTE
jgi:hypothetical protein